MWPRDRKSSSVGFSFSTETSCTKPASGMNAHSTSQKMGQKLERQEQVYLTPASIPLLISTTVSECHWRGLMAPRPLEKQAAHTPWSWCPRLLRSRCLVPGHHSHAGLSMSSFLVSRVQGRRGRRPPVMTPPSRGSSSGLGSLQRTEAMGPSLGLVSKTILQDECSPLWYGRL